MVTLKKYHFSQAERCSYVKVVKMAILLSKNLWNILFYRSMTSSFFYAFSSEQSSVWHFLPFSTQWHVTQNTFLEYSGKLFWALCSRNFQNVKLRLDFVAIWLFYHHSEFTGNQILVNSNGPKMLFLVILEGLNFDFSKFEQLSSPTFTKL